MLFSPLDIPPTHHKPCKLVSLCLLSENHTGVGDPYSRARSCTLHTHITCCRYTPQYHHLPSQLHAGEALCTVPILYHFNWFSCHASQGLWSWPNSVTCPVSQPRWLTTFGGSKKQSKRLLKRYLWVWDICNIFSTYLSKEDTDWSMRDVLEVEMLRYSKIMLGNCCSIQTSLHSSIMSCHQWVIRSPDWPNYSFLTAELFLQHHHSILYLLPLQSPMVGWIFDCVPGQTNSGHCQNFVHLVTGHTPDWINWNGTVLQHLT